MVPPFSLAFLPSALELWSGQVKDCRFRAVNYLCGVLTVYPISFGQHILVLLRPVTQLGPDLMHETTGALVFAKVTRGMVSLMLLAIPVHQCYTPVFLLSRWQCSLWRSKFYCCDLEVEERGLWETRAWPASALATIIRREFSESITDLAKSCRLRF